LKTMIVAAVVAILPTPALTCSPSPSCWFKYGPEYVKSVCSGYAKDKRTATEIAEFLEEPEQVPRFIAACKKLGITFAEVVPAKPLKQMSIDFVGEWCNGSTNRGESNWTLPSWVGEETNGGKCGNILSVTRYDFSMTIEKTSFQCYPDSVRERENTAPSGTGYTATVIAHCAIGDEQGLGRPMTFEFNRYKGNIYIKKK
jgi:hypothetical protein